MRRTLLRAWAGAVFLLAGGCTTGPILDNPALLRTNPTPPVENPVYIPLGPPAYNTLSAATVQVHWADTTYAATHQKTITIDGTTSAIMTAVSRRFRCGRSIPVT